MRNAAGLLLAVGAAGLLVLRLLLPRRARRALPAEGKAVLITGCDKGFGHALAKHLHAKGFTVFAGCLLLVPKCLPRLNPESYKLPWEKALAVCVTEWLSATKCLRDPQHHCIGILQTRTGERSEQGGRKAAKSWRNVHQLGREGLWGCWASQPGAASAEHRVGWTSRAVQAWEGRITGGKEISWRKQQSPTEGI